METAPTSYRWVEVSLLQNMLFFGTNGIFSRVVLERLLASGVSVAALILPAPQPNAPSVTLLSPPQHEMPEDELLLTVSPATQNTVQMAWQWGIPVYAVGRLRSSEIYPLLAAQLPTVACVACFPWRIPTKLLRLPKWGFLNVHPSYLPAYRGPAPLFWQLRNGETHTGVTIHWMDQHFDTGDIAAQAPVSLPDGISGPEIDMLCASVGGTLLADLLHTLEHEPATRQPQPTAGSYHSWPQPQDFTLETSWSARRAFNFMRGTAEWGQVYPIEIDHQQLLLTAALSFTPTGQMAEPLVQHAGSTGNQGANTIFREGSADNLVEENHLPGRFARHLPETPMAQHNPWVEIQFRPGVLTARLT